MNDLQLAASTTTPRVHLPAGGGEAWMEGACYPENAFAFFEPIQAWVDSFRKDGGTRLEFNLRLDYFNTSSSKCLLDLFQSLETAAKERVEVSVRWHYVEDDEDMLESGEEFREDLKLPFELVAY